MRISPLMIGLIVSGLGTFSMAAPMSFEVKGSLMHADSNSAFNYKVKCVGMELEYNSYSNKKITDSSIECVLPNGQTNKEFAVGVLKGRTVGQNFKDVDKGFIYVLQWDQTADGRFRFKYSLKIDDGAYKTEELLVGVQRK
jgi:hypothetical protein